MAGLSSPLSTANCPSPRPMGKGLSVPDIRPPPPIRFSQAGGRSCSWRTGMDAATCATAPCSLCSVCTSAVAVDSLPRHGQLACRRATMILIRKPPPLRAGWLVAGPQGWLGVLPAVHGMHAQRQPPPPPWNQRHRIERAPSDQGLPSVLGSQGRRARLTGPGRFPGPSLPRYEPTAPARPFWAPLLF